MGEPVYSLGKGAEAHMDILLFCHSSSYRPQFSVEETVDDKRFEELLRARDEPSSTVCLQTGFRPYRVLEYGEKDGRGWFLLIESVPLH
jgi:hypothetical protein